MSDGVKLPQGEATASAVRDAHVQGLALIYGIAKLEMKPGDVLVVKVRERLTRDQSRQIHEQIRQLLPNNESMVLSPDIEIEVLSPEGKSCESSS